MKKLIVLSAVFGIFASLSFAANPFDEFKNKLTGVTAEQAQKNLDNLAKDLGGVLGGAAYRSGKTLGFPGVDVSVRVPVQSVTDEDTIVKAAKVDNLLMPFVQAEIGLPLHIDLIGRFSSYQDSTMTGAGLKYMVLKSWIPGVPYVSVQSVYNMLNVSTGDNKLKANTLSTSAIASWSFVVIEPYVGVSYDATTVEPDEALNIGKNGTAGTVRIDAGASIALIPLTYLQLGVSSQNGNMGYTAGLGVKF